MSGSHDGTTKEEIHVTIKEGIEAALSSHRLVSADTHEDHHAFIEEIILCRKARAARWEKVRVHVYGWAAIMFIGAIVAALGGWLKGLLNLR